MKRRCEHADGRFWEVDYTTNVVVVAWGATGKPVQRIERDFPDLAAAAAYAEKHIAAQMAKGYAEVAERAPPPPPPPESRQARFEWREGDVQWFRDVLLIGLKVQDRKGAIDEDGRTDIHDIDTQHLPTLEAANAMFDQICALARARTEEIDLAQRMIELVRGASLPQRDRELRKTEPTYSELEAQCLEAPDTEAPWLVYADYLETMDDPRGTIAARARAGQPVDRLIMNQLVGIADTPDMEPEERGNADHEVSFKFGLRFGFVRHAQITVTYDAAIALAEITRRFLAAPVARFVDSLRFGLSSFEGDNDWGDALRAVVESAQAARMRALVFDAYTYEDQEISWVAYGDFDGLLDQLPALEHLHIRAGQGGTLGALPPSLRVLIRESGGLRRSEIAAILGAPLAHLEHLELWTGSNDYGAECTLTDLERVLDAHDLPRLRHLGIVNSELVDGLIAALATSRILPQLHSLDLSRGIAAGEATDALLAHAKAFRHLASIDLSENMLGEAQTALIRGVLDNVIVDKQRAFSEDRYVAVGE